MNSAPLNWRQPSGWSNEPVNSSCPPLAFTRSRRDHEPSFVFNETGSAMPVGSDLGPFGSHHSERDDIQDDFDLDLRISNLLGYVTIETKRSILHLLEVAAATAIRNETTDIPASSYAAPEGNGPMSEVTSRLSYGNQDVHHRQEVEDQPMLSPTALKEPIYDNHGLSQARSMAHDFPLGITASRRHTFPLNEVGSSESDEPAAPRSQSDPSPPSLNLPQRAHNNQFPHPKVSKFVAAPIALRKENTHSAAPPDRSDANGAFEQPSRTGRPRHNSTTRHVQSDFDGTRDLVGFPSSPSIPTSRLTCNYDDCSATFKGEAEQKRHERSKHLGLNYVCLFPQCPKRDQTFLRKDKIKRHIKEFHSMENVREVPKVWWWPLMWQVRGYQEGWACKLCEDFLGTWDVNRREICGHIPKCRNGHDAREKRWPNRSAIGYDDEDDICRTFRMSLNLYDIQQPGVETEEESNGMEWNNPEKVLFGEY